MELRIPTAEQLREFYRTVMKEAFPPAELKPLHSIENMWAKGQYLPYCLFDDGNTVPIGAAFLWLGKPGWALLDYLCVCAERRNDGLGAAMLQMLPEKETGSVIFGEAEEPNHAPDTAVAARRLAFYTRCGLHTAGYDTKIFGVHYKTLYLADREIPDDILMEAHRFVYSNSFSPEKYAAFIRIPYAPCREREELIDQE